VKECEEAKRRILEENPNIAKGTLECAIITSRAKNTQSHGTGNCICNSRAAKEEMERRLLKKIIRRNKAL
jgi:hypothetical protein